MDGERIRERAGSGQGAGGEWAGSGGGAGGERTASLKMCKIPTSLPSAACTLLNAKKNGKSYYIYLVLWKALGGSKTQFPATRPTLAKL